MTYWTGQNQKVFNEYSTCTTSAVKMATAANQPSQRPTWLKLTWFYSY